MSEDTSTMPPLELTLIVAVSRNMGIGRNGRLPWTGLNKDMAYFKRVTERVPAFLKQDGKLNAIIMGRKTWDSIRPEFKPMKNRWNVVVSHSHVDPPAQDLDPLKEAVKVGSIEQAVQYLRSGPNAAQIGRVFVIGGEQIYRAALELKEARRILLTNVMAEFESDTFFPLRLPESPSDAAGARWVKRSHEELDRWTEEEVPEGIQEENQTQYEFELWERVE
ncbi:dihydrofolate reductase [Xylaria nigripes]|nr:dihydrofolate reductase [Xylaria nigripes]